MANAYLDGLKQFAANSQRDQAPGRPTRMASTGLARTNPPLPPVTAMPPRPGTPNSPGNKPWNDMITTGQERGGMPPAFPTGQPWQKPAPGMISRDGPGGRPETWPGQGGPPQVGWGSTAGQPRPGNTPYAQPPWQPAYGNPQQYQQGMGQRPPTYPPQMRPQQQPFQYQQQGAQPWQTGNQQAPQPGGVPPWMQFAQRPNYQQQFNPYSMPTQGMVRPQTPGQGYDSFMGSWQNPMQGMINNRPTWRPSPAMPSIPQIPAMPQYQGPPNPWAQAVPSAQPAQWKPSPAMPQYQGPSNPWAQAVPSAQPAQQNQQSPAIADYLRVMRGY